MLDLKWCDVDQAVKRWNIPVLYRIAMFPLCIYAWSTQTPAQTPSYYDAGSAGTFQTFTRPRHITAPQVQGEVSQIVSGKEKKGWLCFWSTKRGIISGHHSKIWDDFVEHGENHTWKNFFRL